MNRAKHAIYIFLFLFSGYFAACSASPKDAIVGKWTEIGGTEVMELFKDGTITITDQGQYSGGHYSFIEEDRIKLELGGRFASVGPIVARVAISGDTLTWTMPDGQLERYRRAP